MHIVLSPLVRAITAQTIGVLIGAYINIYCMSKWKVILKGKYFWLRSIGSSLIGEGITLIISVFVALIGVLSIDKLVLFIFYAYLYKIIFALFVAPFGAIIANLLKDKEGIDTYDYFIDLNPFRSS